MAGIYIHIPFCRKACHYCNFHFSTSLQKAPDMLMAIEKELVMRSSEIKEDINTIYFGGGTPSLVESEDIARLLSTINKHFHINKATEITLEANPDDITEDKATNWKALGINRFSLGIQSFADENLRWMNRAHNASQSFQAIDTIRQAGFDNFSIDLIYGTPGQTAKEWINDIQTALNLAIPHLSCYALTVEDKTALQTLIKKGEKQAVSTDEQAERFQSLMQLTHDAGYHHYEISNFALPGWESKHNSAYWEGIPYLGVGPSAHSYDGHSRRWNIANNTQYIDGIVQNDPVYEQEILRAQDKINEYCMTSIRRSIGIERKKLDALGGEALTSSIAQLIQPYIASKKVEELESGWRLTNEGKFFADGIASSLFIVD